MSTLTESLAQDRHAARYSKAARAPRRPAATQASRRTRLGWLLVGLGLRLALPGHQSGGTGRQAGGTARQTGSGQITLVGR